MRSRNFRPTALGILLAAGILAAAAAQAAEFDCHGPRFRDGNPPINEAHIFCGEIRNGKPEGYHSERIQPTPNVGGVSDIRPVGAQGVYEGIVHFVAGGAHRSTFFPRACSIAQIETSIRHAAAHPIAGRGNDWSYGPSAPLANSAGYCLGSDGRPFEIQFARTRQGGVNTAFPDGH
jgi:hypothetical protein